MFLMHNINESYYNNMIVHDPVLNCYYMINTKKTFNVVSKINFEKFRVDTRLFIP